MQGVPAPANQDLPANMLAASQGLQQASNQAPRVPLDQIIPGSSQMTTPPPNTAKPGPSKARRIPSQRAKQGRASDLLHPGQCRTFQATAYGPPWGGQEGSEWAANGMHLTPGRHLVAVDPRIIPLGSKIRIWPNPHHWPGEFIAADTGSLVQGNTVDIFAWQGPAAMDSWGRRQVQVCRKG